MSIVGEMIRGVLAVDPAANALEYRKRWYSWGELAAVIDAVDRALNEAGLGEGARVGILLRNRPQPFAALVASVVTDRCLVTLNPVMPNDKLVADLHELQLPVVVAETADLEREGVLDALAACGTAVVELTGDAASPARLRPGFESPSGAGIRRDQPGIIIEMLTSGTTGKPKRVPLATRNFERGFKAGLAYEKGRSADEAPKLRSGIQFLMLPLTHITGLWGAVTQMAAGRKSCLIEKFNVEEWRDAVVRHRPKMFMGPPATLRMILDADVPKEDLASIVAIRTGTAPLDPAIADAFFERYNIPVLQNYGATEFAGAVAGWSLEDFLKLRTEKAGSVGRVHGDVEARIVDPDSGDILAPGAEGVLELRAAQLGDAKAWLRTTDRAVLDADHFLWIKGRADNAIIRGGFKVHPDDVVQILESHPAIKEAAVVGLPDARLGQVPVAALVLRPGFDAPSDATLAAVLKEKLLPYQVPVRFLWVAALPRTPSMKVSQPMVRDLFADQPATA